MQADQHFVHHHLKEQGGDQAKELEHEADEQYLAQEFAVFDHREDKPAEVKLGQLTSLIEPAILFLMAGVVITILLAIYLPLLQMVSKAGAA